MAQRTDDLADWLRLEQTAGVGAETARRLLRAFGLPANIFSASFSALRQVVPDRIAEALAAPVPHDARRRIEQALAWSELHGNAVLTLADDSYPKQLLDIPDPPLLLYARGRLDLLAAPAIAVVGSRNATAQGIRNAETFSEALSQAGLTIVSGMALGIDAAAHWGGLRGNGSTVAVVGTGIDIVYPLRNQALADKIAAEGCIISEYALGMPAIAANFPRRNRIISGLARGVLVVEAALRSGSQITARTAAEQGRDVFAIPGSIHAPLSKGCHQLIKQGAKLTESVQDILEELGSCQAAQTPSMQPVGNDDGIDDIVLQALGFDPVNIDTLAERCALDSAALGARLLTLELAGFVEMLPGGMYRRLG